MDYIYPLDDICHTNSYITYLITPSYPTCAILSNSSFIFYLPSPISHPPKTILLVSPITADLLDITQINDCLDPADPVCNIRFVLDRPTDIQYFQVPTWPMTPNVISYKGTCLFEPSNSTLILTPSNGKNFVTCGFGLFPNFSFTGVQIGTNPDVKTPVLAYYTSPFEFTPDLNDDSCSTELSALPCYGTFRFPFTSFPVVIKTTSNLVTEDPNIKVIVDSTQPIGLDSTLSTYTIEFIGSNPDAVENIEFHATLTKSAISPYLEFYNTFGILLGRSNIPVLTGDLSLGLGTDCYTVVSNLCTIGFTLNTYTPRMDTITIVPTSYLKPSPVSDLLPCPDGFIDLVHQGTIALCQTFRKTINTVSNRLPLNEQFSVHILGQYFDSKVTYDLSGIYYIAPITFEMDIDECSNPDTPICVGYVRSIYNHGPPVHLSFSIPFIGTISQNECNSNLMSVTTDSVSFPSKDVANNEDGWIHHNLPYLECKISWIIGYKTEYIFNNYDGNGSNREVQLLSYRENLESIVHQGFGVGATIPLPDRENIQFKSFPIQITVNPNCSEGYMEECTLVLSVDPKKTNKNNYFRSFEIYLPGSSIDYVVNFGRYTFTLEGTVATTIEIEPYVLATTDSRNTFGFGVIIFNVVLVDTKGFDHYLSEDEPVTITITYHKEHNAYTLRTVPTFLTYGGLPLSEQPPIEELLPGTSDSSGVYGYDVISRPDVAPFFAEDCADETSHICSVTLTRWDIDAPSIWFVVQFSSLFINDYDSTIEHLRSTGLDENGVPFIVSTGIIPGTNIGGARLDWNQFKVDPDDPNEPLPHEKTLGFVKNIGRNSLLTITIYNTNIDENTPPDVPKFYVYSTESRFILDGIPTFDTELCNSEINPYCYATYSSRNSIPPNYCIISHPFSTSAAINSARITSCKNINQIDVINPDDGSTTKMWPFVLNITRAGQPDHTGIIRDMDFLSWFNSQNTILRPIVPGIPITCDVTFVLENVISKVQRVEPYIIMNQNQLQHNKVSFGLPRMVWLPASVYPGSDCLTQSFTRAFCTFATSFFGTARDPLSILEYFLPTTFLRHPLIPLGTYKLFLQPVRPEDEATTTVPQIGGFSLLFVSGDSGPRHFKFVVFPEWQHLTFTAYFLVSNQVMTTDTGFRTILVPGLNLPVNVNGQINEVPANFYIPAILSGPIIQTFVNQTKFQSPGWAQLKLNFRLDVNNMYTETNFGNTNPIPCLQMDVEDASIPDSDTWVDLRWKIFNEISALKTYEEQKLAFQKYVDQGTFAQNKVTSPKIMGWYEPFDPSPNADQDIIHTTSWSSARKITSPHSHFHANNEQVPVLTNLSCFMYVRVNQLYPSNRDNVYHHVHITYAGASTDSYSIYSNYPRYTPQANLLPTDYVTPIVKF